MFYGCEANFGSPAVGGEDKSKTCFRFIETTPGGKASRSEDLLAPKSPFLYKKEPPALSTLGVWKSGVLLGLGSVVFGLGRRSKNPHLYDVFFIDYHNEKSLVAEDGSAIFDGDWIVRMSLAILTKERPTLKGFISEIENIARDLAWRQNIVYYDFLPNFSIATDGYYIAQVSRYPEAKASIATE